MTENNSTHILFKQKIVFISFIVVLIGTAIFLKYREHVYLFFSKHSPNIVTQTVNGSDRISISKDYIFDLSGAEASGGSNPYKLFDEHCDPKNGLEGKPRTDPLPSRGWDIFFLREKDGEW